MHVWQGLQLLKINEFGSQLSWPGRPQTYKAPRWGRQGRMYSVHTREMGSVALQITRKPCKGQTETRNLSRPVLVEIELFFRRPKAHYRASGELQPRAPNFCCKRPDVDNYRLNSESACEVCFGCAPTLKSIGR